MNDTDLKINLLIATLLQMISIEDSTRIVDKLKKQVRKGIEREPDSRLKVMIASTNAHWEAVKAQIGVDNAKYEISLSLMISTLYDLLSNGSKWYSAKTMEKVVSNLEHGYELQANTETDTTTLSDIFREELGIKPKNLSGLKSFIKIQKDNKELF